MKTYRIFFSSPGDVGEERQRARDVVALLSAEFTGRVEIEALFWEDRPMRVTADFQAQIPSTDQFDAVVCVLWSRLGTPLRPGPDGREWESGTEYEVVTAKEAASKTGLPDILIYRKSSELSVAPSAAECERFLREFERLERFWEEHCVDSNVGRIKGAYTRYKDTHQFEAKLTEHLRQLLREHIGPITNTATQGKPTWEMGSPFRGLRVFECEHAPVFHGRSAAIAEVLDTLRRRLAIGKGMLVISGASGSGKSSLVRAGVLPKLVASGVLEGFTAWRRVVFIPGDGGDPFLSLAHQLLEEQGLPELATSAEDLARRLASGPVSGMEVIVGALRQVASESRQQERHILEAKAAEMEKLGKPAEAAKYREVLAGLPAARAGLALVVDQLEEAFTQIDDPGKRVSFFELLSVLAASGQVVLLATLRADYWPQLIEIPVMSALAQGDGRYDLLAPRPSELEEMITRPAIAAGLVFEAEPDGARTLDREILDEAVRAQDALPLLQFALESLDQSRTPDGTLTWKAWGEIGGLEGALRHHASKAFRDLPKATAKAAPDVFRRLVDARLGDAGGLLFNRRWVPMSAFSSYAERAFVNAMITERLLVASALPGGEAACSLAHEALISNWTELRKHLDREESLHLLRSWMRPYFSDWTRSDRGKDSLLPKGARLTELHGLIRERRTSTLFSDVEKEFIEASVRYSPAPVNVILKQGTKLTLNGAAPIVVILLLLWFTKPTLLHDFLGKLRKSDYQTGSEKEILNHLHATRSSLLQSQYHSAIQDEALNSLINGITQPGGTPTTATETSTSTLGLLRPSGAPPSGSLSEWMVKEASKKKPAIPEFPTTWDWNKPLKFGLTPDNTKALSPFLSAETLKRLQDINDASESDPNQSLKLMSEILAEPHPHTSDEPTK